MRQPQADRLLGMLVTIATGIALLYIQVSNMTSRVLMMVDDLVVDIYMTASNTDLCESKEVTERQRC